MELDENSKQLLARHLMAEGAPDRNGSSAKNPPSVSSPDRHAIGFMGFDPYGRSGQPGNNQPYPRTSGCSASQRAQIANAMPIVQKAANGQGLGSQFSQIIDNTTFVCRPSGQGLDYCGANKDDGKIYLKDAFNEKKCGSLIPTIGHEITHSAPLNYPETEAFAFEHKAFGRPMPTPERFRLEYQDKTEDEYNHYQQIYHQEMKK